MDLPGKHRRLLPALALALASCADGASPDGREANHPPASAGGSGEVAEAAPGRAGTAESGAGGGVSSEVVPTPGLTNARGPNAPGSSADAMGGGSGDAPIDADTSYPDATQRVYLTGKGTDDAVDWDFVISSGRRAGVASTLPVPSNWEMHGFGTLAYGFNASTEVGTYRRAFELPPDWAGKQIFVVLEGSMTDTSVSINAASAGPLHQGAFYRFRHDITNLVQPGENQIEIVVSEESADASVNAAERQADYWNFGGIAPRECRPGPRA